ALAGDGAAHRSRQPIPGAVVIEPSLRVLIAGEGEPVAPPLLVPRRFDQPPAVHRIPNAQRRGIAAVKPAPLREANPLPYRPENGHEQALHVPGRHVYEQIADLAARYGLEVLDNGVDVPARHERRGRLDNRPRLAHKLPEAAPGEFGVNFV